MDDPLALLTLLAALLLAAPAGLNPYLPLLIVSALARFSSFYQPVPPLSFLGQSWFMLLVGALFLTNALLDKAFLPGDSLLVPPSRRNRRLWVGALHDLGQMLLGPAAGALLAGATSRFFPSGWFLAAPMLGALLSALVYTGKRALRHHLSGRWGPFTNMFLSLLEDVAVVLTCLAGLLLRR